MCKFSVAVYSNKYSDDSVLLVLLMDNDDIDLFPQGVDGLVDWCNQNDLINTKKTEEVIFGLSPDSYPPPLRIHDQEIKQVTSYKYLGVYIDAALSWNSRTDYVCSKV